MTPQRFGAIAAMQLAVATLIHDPETIESLRGDIGDRAEALGLVCDDVQFRLDGDVLHATAEFAMRDEEGTPWRCEFQRVVQAAA